MIPEQENTFSRREFIVLLAFWSGWASLGIALLDSLKDPQIQLKDQTVLLGHYNDYALNSVSFFPVHRAWLIRDVKGFYALKAVCPHLGCQPRWDQEKFACPCHGSFFDRTGKVLQGPALRSLERFHIFATPQGQIGLDLNQTYLMESESISQSGAFLAWPS